MRCLSVREFAHMPIISRNFPGGKVTFHYEMINIFQRPHCYRMTINCVLNVIFLDKFKSYTWKAFEAIGNEDNAIARTVKSVDPNDPLKFIHSKLHYENGTVMIQKREFAVFPTLILPEFDTSFASEAEIELAKTFKGLRSLGNQRIDYQACEGWNVEVNHIAKEVQFWVDPARHEFKKLVAPVTLDSYALTAQLASYIRGIGVQLNAEKLMTFNANFPSDIFIDDTQFNDDIDLSLFEIPKDF